MGISKGSVWLTARIEAEKKKIEVLEARRKANATLPYEPRDTVDVLVPSLEAPKTKFYEVSVTKSTLVKVCGANFETALNEIGCLAATDLPATGVKVPNKYNTARYFSVLIIHGAGTPQRMTTEWNTRWTKTYAPNGDQSHRLFPFGADPVIATPDADDVVDYFDLQCADTGPINTAIGTIGSAYLMLGKEMLSSYSKG